jgi:hypothetical protein
LESLAPSLRYFDAAFEHLEILDLELRDWRYPDTGFELESTRAPFVVRFLAKARNVRHLKLGCYSSLDDDLFGDMARHCIFGKLETCTLKHFRLHKALDLPLFLRSCCSTLTSLSLHHIFLRDDSATWSSVFTQLAWSDDILQNLETLYLAKLFLRSGARVDFSEENYDRQEQLFGAPGNRDLWRDELLWYGDGVLETTGPPWHLAAVAYPFMGMRT